MKKSIVLFLLVFSLNINAQTFDETQLSGTWKVEEITGTLPMRIVGFETLVMEEAMMVWDEEYDDWDWYPNWLSP